jgi:hypothetical protein
MAPDPDKKWGVVPNPIILCHETLRGSWMRERERQSDRKRKTRKERNELN